MTIELNLDFHHFGLALKQTATAEVFLHANGYSIGEWVYDPLQNVELCLCSHISQPDVELISPSKNSESGPLDTILKDSEQMIYHICYQVQNIEESVNDLKNNNIRIVALSEKKPALLFGNREVAFYFIKGFGLIELLNEQ